MQHQSGAIWLHAVSVGEVVSLLPLLRLLREHLPNAPLYLSTSTTAGRQIAERQAAPLVNGLFYLPFDFGFCLRRAFRTIRPALLVIVETEIWPNLFALANYSGTSLALINSRISDRTWPTYQKWSALFSSLLQLPNLVQVQSPTDFQRYEELGVPRSALLLDANLKYDATPAASALTLPTFGARQIWIAASTVGPNERGSLVQHAVDEDDAVLSTFQELATQFPQLLLIVAPRQPARFDEVASKVKALHLNFQRRSEKPEHLALPGVFLLDTMGELAQIYSLANVVFVGGSIAPRGGHNIIEPAAAGVPVIIGPHMHNFQAIAQDFLEADAVIQIRNASKLTSAVREVLLNPQQGRKLGQRGQALVERQRGVSERALHRLMPLYHLGSFHQPHSLPVQMLLNGLAWLWRVGGVYKRRRGEQYAASHRLLPVPIISIGGLGVGGAGKTPFTITVAKLLITRGAKPGILTRGYKRSSKENVIAHPGASIPVADTGEEAQIFLHTLLAPVGIGANRYETGRLLLDRFPETTVLLLDDGFQHARLRRTVDIVLIDGLDPFGNGRLLPAGRLREPLAALGRAQIAVVTKCESDIRFAAITDKLRQVNTQIMVFRTDTITSGWRDSSTGEVVNLRTSQKTAAFCALGNPQSFWKTLDSLSIVTTYRKSFSDHHRYTSNDIRQLIEQARATGADVLLTTEKDFFNLPEQTLPMKLLYLPIELVIREEQKFLELIGM